MKLVKDKQMNMNNILIMNWLQFKYRATYFNDWIHEMKSIFLSACWFMVPYI